MKSFLMFVLAIIAVFVFLANLGPLILFGISIFLLYVIYKQFIKAESTASKVVWIILGLLVLSMTVSNVFALIGVVALYFLYVMFRGDKGEKPSASSQETGRNSDPFTNFEREWAELNK